MCIVPITICSAKRSYFAFCFQVRTSKKMKFIQIPNKSSLSVYIFELENSHKMKTKKNKWKILTILKQLCFSKYIYLTRIIVQLYNTPCPTRTSLVNSNFQLYFSLKMVISHRFAVVCCPSQCTQRVENLIGYSCHSCIFCRRCTKKSSPNFGDFGQSLQKISTKFSDRHMKSLF